MGIGASIFLIAVGAVLAFAVKVNPSGLDVSVVGWILMIVGLLGLLLTMLIWGRQRSARLVVRESYPPRVIEREVPPTRVVEREVLPPPIVERDVYPPRRVERIVEDDGYYPP